ncbi:MULTISPECIES: carbon-nitrogen hydrolase family protein [unclassified Mycolicibacterium]|uniref:carbon-nitrogen hydrolase family protein n=1 Tax=unclassified Mycolicibacterium TaxID=2636767 RepID=UPI002EDA9C7A
MSISKERLKVAGLQSPGSPGDVAANIAELARSAGAAVKEGADLLITPELFVTGYDIGDSIRSLARQDLLSPICRIADDLSIALIVGVPELTDGTLYNSAVFVDPSGSVKAVHRKTHLFGELDRRYFTAGDEAATVVEYMGVRIGMMICYDVEFAENARMAALKGVEFLAVPTAQMEPFEFVADSVIRTRAWENQMYVAYVNHSGRERDTVYVGRSSVVAPDATVLSRIVAGEGIIYGDVETAVVREARKRNPYLSDLRPDLNAPLVSPLAVRG